MGKRVAKLYLELSHALADLDDPPMCSQPVYRDWFFPEGFIPQKGVSSASYLAQQKAIEMAAVRICHSCPVKALCAEYAIVAKEAFGCWGGTTPATRSAIYAEANKSAKSST
jgi:hypothetical protein